MKLFKVVVLVLMFSVTAHANEIEGAISDGNMTIDTDPFYLAYERASLIVLATVESLSSSDQKIEELSKESALENFKKARLNVKKIWKGLPKQNKKIDIYFFRPPTTVKETREGKTVSLDSDNGTTYIFFIRQLKGRYIVAPKFRILRYYRENEKESALYKALDSLSMGKSMEEAVKILGGNEAYLFNESRK